MASSGQAAGNCGYHAGMATDPSRCPLCGGANECGVAAGQDTCWCFSSKIPAEVVASVPEDDVNRVCVCRACAGATDGALDGPAPEPASREEPA